MWTGGGTAAATGIGIRTPALPTADAATGALDAVAPELFRSLAAASVDGGGVGVRCANQDD